MLERRSVRGRSVIDRKRVLTSINDALVSGVGVVVLLASNGVFICERSVRLFLELVMVSV